MTTKTTITKARRFLDDMVAPYRWEDDELREHLQAAVRRLNALAPTTRYLPDGTMVDFIALPSDDNAAIPVDDKYAESLALYIAYLAYFNDATDTVNAERAASCLQRAEGMMV